MPDLLDDVQWKRWPKNPRFEFVDLPCRIRVSRRTCADGSTAHYLRELDEDGEFAGGQYGVLTRAETIALIARLRPALFA